VAAQAYRIAGAVVVGDVLEGESGGVPEGWEDLGGQELASVLRRGRPTTLFRVYAPCSGKSLLFGGAAATTGRSGAGAGAIRHPRVQIEEGAGVDAFLMGEPWFLPRGGYGPVAAEAY
jgi:hypothetical protein